MKPSALIHAGVLGGLLACGAAFAQEGTRDLIDSSLSSREVRLVAVTPESVQFKDVAGRPGTLPRSEVLALLPAAGSEEAGRERPAEARAVARLTDGRVLPGSPGGGGGGDSIEWRSSLWSLVRLKFDVLSSVTLRPEGVVPEAGGATGDVVGLVNGDRIEGFVESIDRTLVMDQEGRKTQLPLDRIAGVRFANPAKPPEGARIWLYDGTVAGVASVEVSPQGEARLVSMLAGASGPANTTLLAGDLRAIAFDMGRVRPLAGLERHVLDGGEGRRWTPPVEIGDQSEAALGAAEVVLPGPIEVEWTLPNGAIRLAGVAELPPDCRAWGDCELVVTVTGAAATMEVFRARLNRGQPSAVFNVELKGAARGGVLRTSVRAVGSGAIQDRVVLRRALVLVEQVGT